MSARVSIEASNVPLPLDAGLPGREGERFLHEATAQALGLSASAAVLCDVQVLRRSVDARRRREVHFIARVRAELDAEALKVSSPAEAVLRLRPAKGVQLRPFTPCAPLVIPRVGSLPGSRPVVVGAGPAGLFAALYLAEAGLRPVLVERGASVEERQAAVDAFAAGGPLDEDANVQFGEGGAGAFSDGKLTTGTKSPHIRHVLQAFVDAGAPADILWQAKPHIGTDVLPGVVRSLRERIQRAGATVLFGRKLVGLRISGGAISAVELACGPYAHDATDVTEVIPTSQVILACGHSARDTFDMLRDAGAAMERKPFAMGVRIEHSQEWLDLAQYGPSAGHEALGAADYKLAVHLPDGRGVYTFCMCPGGYVVAASSEQGGVCVNGMSRAARDGSNCNSALLVEIRPADLPGTDPLEGVRLQRHVEQVAYRAGLRGSGIAYAAPAQTVGDFLGIGGRAGEASISPTYPRGLAWCNLRDVLPADICDALAEALPLLDRKLPGFTSSQAVMTAVCARSSSPVRIVRDPETLESVSIAGLYPCGEGAGYAGGIMSAACDGIRVAEVLCHSLQSCPNSPAAKQASLPAQAVAALRAGKPVIFPTDTVYGLGVSVLHARSPQALYDLKRREAGKPVAWLVGGAGDLCRFGEQVPAYAEALARRFWPGPLTLVVKASSQVPPAFLSDKGTLGLRMPANDLALELIRAMGCPLATTSANLSGSADTGSFDQLDARLVSHVGCVLRGDVLGSGIASTVVDCTGHKPCILREGSISHDAILATCGQAS